MQKLSSFPRAILKYVVSSHRISLRHALEVDLETVYTKLLHFENFAHFHPYMKKVTCNKQASTNYKDYSVEEEVYLFGFLRNRPRYIARVSEPIEGKQIRYTSQVKPGLCLCIDFKFSRDQNGNVVIDEEIELQTHRFIAFIFFKILKKTHLQVFEAMRAMTGRDIYESARELRRAG